MLRTLQVTANPRNEMISVDVQMRLRQVTWNCDDVSVNMLLLFKRKCMERLEIAYLISSRLSKWRSTYKNCGEKDKY